MFNGGQGGYFGGNPMQQQDKRGGGLFGGGKIGGRDIAGLILGAIGDGLATHNGGRPMAAQFMMQRAYDERERAAREQEEARERQQQEYQAARQRQALKGLGLPDNQIEAYAAGVGGAIPQQATPGSFAWYQNASPEQRAQYDEYNPVTVATGAGPVRVPRNRPAVGTTVRMDQIGGATTSNTPAPELGANGQPTTLTRQQYQAVVNSMGQQRTDEWARRNNIRIGS